MDKHILSPNEKIYSTPNRNKERPSSKRTASDSKSRFSDRFIPSSINRNLLDDFESTFNKIEQTDFRTETQLKKSESNYRKLLQSEILEERTPSINLIK